MISKVIRKLKYIFRVLYSKAYLMYLVLLGKQINVPRRITFTGLPVILLYKNTSIEFGENCVIDSKKYLNPLTISKRSSIKTLKENAKIKIGNNVGMSGVTICCMDEIRIGNNVGIGSNSIIVDTNFHPTDPSLPKEKWDDLSLIATSPVIIEDNVIIGMNVTILKGVKVGSNSVIGANCLVAKDVPPNSICLAAPASIKIKSK
jgi:acetyltransferase-like isoleucine patch superfamily enzyme